MNLIVKIEGGPIDGEYFRLPVRTKDEFASLISFLGAFIEYSEAIKSYPGPDLLPQRHFDLLQDNHFSSCCCVYEWLRPRLIGVEGLDGLPEDFEFPGVSDADVLVRFCPENWWEALMGQSLAEIQVKDCSN